MLRVVIIVSGRDYQEAAAWAAATYTGALERPAELIVYLPEGEPHSRVLKNHSRRFGFAVERFPFYPVSERKFTSQLKCQGFHHAISQLSNGDVLLLVDADTYCLQPLGLTKGLLSSIGQGTIGLSPDIMDRHDEETSPADPWYLAPSERAVYVNSGIIAAGRSALGLFEKFRELSEQPAFLHGPFNDQKVINFALGRYFRDRLVLLDRGFNGIHLPGCFRRPPPGTIIGHCAGGAGLINWGDGRRKTAHQKICESIIKDEDWPF